MLDTIIFLRSSRYPSIDSIMDHLFYKPTAIVVYAAVNFTE